MPSRKVFYDKDGNELDCFVNNKGALYIGVQKENDDMQFGFITLNKTDVKDLIKLLQELEEEVEEEIELNEI